MDHIVAMIHPFVVNQEISVYRNGECIKVVDCKLEEVTKICYNLCKEYNIHQLDLVGQQLYALHIKDELAAKEYDDFNLEITIF